MDEQSKYHRFQYKLFNNQYELGEIIDSGGFCAVLYAKDPNGFLKAIKIIDLTNVREEAKRSLEQEHRAMKSIHSDYVIRCENSQVDQTRSFRFIVMELCNYFNLWCLIFFKGHFKELEAHIYLKNILAGLISMHNQGYSHRDIKSSNICLRNGQCVIIDLGCSKNCVNTGNGESFNNTIPKTGTKIGTAINKSPQMLSSKKYSYRTDFWAIGILYYEMLTGVTPFKLTGDEDDVTALKIIVDNIGKIYDKEYIKKRIKQEHANISSTFVKRANTKISPQARAFLSKLITVDPEKRFNEKQLKECEYLKKEPELTKDNIWDVAACLLPLVNINWRQFVQKVDKEAEEKLENNQPKQFQSQIQQQPLSSLPQQKISSLKKSYEEKIAKDIANFSKLQIYNFQIKRIKNLLEVHKEFKSIHQSRPNLHCASILIGISSYCSAKLASVMGVGKFQKSLGVFSTRINEKLGPEFLSQYVSDIVIDDQRRLDSISIENTSSAIEAQKLMNQHKSNLVKLSKEAQCYLSHKKQIFEFNFVPDQEYWEWEKTWSSLQQIYYEDQVKKNKQKVAQKQAAL